MYNFEDITAVIVYFNGDQKVVSKALDLSYLGHVLVVNNGSNVESSKLLEELRNNSKVEVIDNIENKGIAYALNQGLDYAISKGSKLLLTLDQDSSISKNCIYKLKNKIDVANKIVSVGPIYKQNSIIENDKEVSFLITSGNIIDVNTLKTIGGFWNDLFIDCVDIDLSFNLKSKGYKQLMVANAFMTHKIGEYEKSPIFHIKYLGHSNIRYYYKFRNNWLIYKKYWNKLFKDCLKLFVCLVIEFFRVIFIEKNKKEKIKYIFLGLKDVKKIKVGQ